MERPFTAPGKKQILILLLARVFISDTACRDY